MRGKLTAGAPRYQGKGGLWAANKAIGQAERELAQQAELAYINTVRDWAASAPAKVGASATPGRASQRPSKGKAARQTP